MMPAPAERILCRTCGGPVSPDELVLCSKCESPNHNLCWAERGWCPIRSCGSTTMKRLDGLSSPDPEPQQRRPPPPAPSRESDGAPPRPRPTRTGPLMARTGEAPPPPASRTPIASRAMASPEEDGDIDDQRESEALRQRIAALQAQLDDADIPPITRLLPRVLGVGALVPFAMFAPDALIHPLVLAAITAVVAVIAWRSRGERHEIENLRDELQRAKLMRAGASSDRARSGS